MADEPLMVEPTVAHRNGRNPRSTLRLLVIQAVANAVANVLRFTGSSSGANPGTFRATGHTLDELIMNQVVTAIAIAVWTGAWWLIVQRHERVFTLRMHRAVCAGWIVIGILSSVAALPVYWDRLGHDSVYLLAIGTVIVLGLVNGGFIASTKQCDAGLIWDTNNAFERFMTSKKSNESHDLRPPR